MYSTIYKELCERNRTKREGITLHQHHIIPKHAGGLDTTENFTYLTPREHQIAHFLLWKIHRDVNDLRSMKMLGARLTSLQRKIIGDWCVKNKIGIHSIQYKQDWEANSIRTKRSSSTCKVRGIGIFDKSMKSEWARNAGKIGGTLQKKQNLGIHNPANFKKNAAIGGKAIRGMICVTNGNHRTRIKPENLQEYISRGYSLGFTLSSSI